jgi:hypothetical protein
LASPITVIEVHGKELAAWFKNQFEIAWASAKSPKTAPQDVVVSKTTNFRKKLQGKIRKLTENVEDSE